MNYKAQLRIPTEQYAYVEVEVEGTPDEIWEAYKQFMAMSKPQTGISDKDFNTFLDNMLVKGEANHVEVFQAMSEKQKDVIQHLKRAIKRIKPKE